jgi:hypothetical protein
MNKLRNKEVEVFTLLLAPEKFLPPLKPLPFWMIP